MLIKKIAITAVAGAVMLSAAAGAFADYSFAGNWAHVNTGVNSTSNTGGNLMGVGGNTSYNNTYGNGGSNSNGTANHSYTQTGSATTHTFVLQATNTNLGTEGLTFNGAKVNTYVASQSNTGNNVMGGAGNTNYTYSGSNGGNNSNGTANHSYTTTGNAYTHTTVVNVVNTNVSGF